MKEIMVTLFEYNYHAHKRILDQAAKLTEAQFNESVRESENSLSELLFHTMRTEWMWRNLAQKGTLPGPPPAGEAFSALETLHSRWLEEEGQMLPFLNTMTDDSLREIIELTDRNGAKHHYSRWGMLMHLLMHSMQHRSEAAVMLTEYGYSPGDMDLIFFLAGRKIG